MAKVWNNWSGFQTGQPQHYLRPITLDALKDVIKKHQKIRVVGAGHSFSPLVNTDDTLISLDNFQGLISHDQRNCQAELWAGTRIYQLPQIFEKIDQALVNQGDIDQQSLAGAMSTGTHGTGSQLGCLSSLIEGFELLTAEGEILSCNRQQNSEIFAAGRVALGSLGVVTRYTLQNRPRYKLKEHVRLCPVQDILADMNQWRHQHRHIESFIFPFHSEALLKTLDETDEQILLKKNEWPSEDSLLTLCCEVTRLLPSSVGSLQKLVGLFVRETTQINWSGAIFPSPRNTRFNEMEYQIPLEQGMQCLDEVIQTFRKKKLPAFFPIEVRYVQADDIWLSPFYQQDSLSISVHQYARQDHQQIFKFIEPVFQKYGGRPHWGKLHSLKASALQELYPKWQEFHKLRQTLDPEHKFINQHLHDLFME